MYCYICKKKIEKSHYFYKNMCEICGDLNYEKRNELANLEGYVAIITGGRIKIGYETALKFLRSRANVIITTRFPYNAAQRFSKEEDFDCWKNKLKIYGIDFRITPYLYEFIEFVKQNYSHVDILINNAAQTVRPSSDGYQRMIEEEHESQARLDSRLFHLLPNRHYIRDENYLYSKKSIIGENNLVHYSSITKTENICSDALNSWNSRACDVSVVELLEVQLINVTAPFILATELKSLMEKSPHRLKYIINVSAMEGKFNKKNKNCFHPHTNMCKAALNMFTRTSAQDYVHSGILMNSVDTGWITDENPQKIKLSNISKGIVPQLDEKDGASRICDPIFSSINRNNHFYGKFMKDYVSTGW